MSAPADTTPPAIPPEAAPADAAPPSAALADVDEPSWAARLARCLRRAPAMRVAGACLAVLLMIKAGGGDAVRATPAGDQAPPQGEARLRGSRHGDVFLYWPADGRSEAMVSASIARIQSLPRRGANR